MDTFAPFEDGADDDYDPLDDANPDLNFFNSDVQSISNALNSYYYAEDDLNDNDIVTSHSYDLAMFHMNIRSLPKNNDALKMYLSSLRIRFDVIALSETWLSAETCELPYISNDYSHIKMFRDNRRGGGTSLFIHDSCEHHPINELNVSNEYIECIFAELKHTVNSKSTVVGAIYRPPNTDIVSFLDHLSTILSHQALHSKNIYLMGDFNINLLNHSTHQHTADFIDMMFQHSLLPMVNRPTRFSNTTNTLIDCLFTNNTEVHSSLTGILLTDISDHLPIIHLTPLRDLTKISTPQNNHKVPIINPNTLNSMSRALLTQDWHHVFNTNDPEEAFNNFSSIIAQAYSNHIPLRQTSKKRHGKPWITSAIMKSIKRKNKLYSIYLKHKTHSSLTYYKKYKNKLSSIIRTAEKSYYNTKLNKNKDNLKNTWKIIKDIIDKNQNKIANLEFKINDRLIKDKQAISEEFNNYFINVGPSLAATIQNSQTNPISYLDTTVNYPSIFLSPTSEHELEKIVHELKPASPGHDNLTTRLIKHIFPTISKPLTHLINRSLETGHVPTEIKIAKVIPIYKAGDPKLLSNYRPISILPIFSKIYEKIMYSRLEAHLTLHNILSPYQFGFRHNHSTAMAVSIFVDSLYTILNQHKFAIATFLDLSKAFDLVNHDILLKKLHHYGVRGIAHQWFKNYLQHRKQYVFHNHSKSSLKDIICGVPQGSVLGPILFLIYINDLCLQSPSLKFVLFADDTNLLISGDTVAETVNIMNRELSAIETWFKSNCLFINLQKTNFMVFSTKASVHNSPFSLHINGHKLEQVSKTKFLGVIIDNKLNWEHHITYVKSKISKCIGLLLRARTKVYVKNHFQL